MREERVSSHLQALRRTVLISLLCIIGGSACAFPFYRDLFSFAMKTLPLNHWGNFSETPLLILTPLEGVNVALKVSFLVGFCLTSPVWGGCWISFIWPALLEKEKRVAFSFLIGSGFSGVIALLIAYYFTLPLVNEILFTFSSAIGQNAWSLASYLDYLFLFFFSHVGVGEGIWVMWCLVHYQFVTAEQLAAKRRHMIVISLILGALLTPPDVVTQLLFALPLIGCYEIAIAYAHWVARWRHRPAARNQRALT